MPEITLTSFVDFVSKSGTPKLTVVRRTLKQFEEGYGPEKDFYKRIREAIVDMHRSGKPLSEVSNILPGLTDKKKMANYPKLFQGYKKWTGWKGAQWFNPPSVSWQSGELNVRVNPELGLTIKSTPHLIKLYFKADALTKNRIDIITHLMAVTCGRRTPKGCVMGVLDIRRSKLFTPTVPIDELGTSLRAEAAYWMAAWRELSTTKT